MNTVIPGCPAGERNPREPIRGFPAITGLIHLASTPEVHGTPPSMPRCTDFSPGATAAPTVSGADP